MRCWPNVMSSETINFLLHLSNSKIHESGYRYREVCNSTLLLRDIVDIVALVRCWSNVGMPTPTFPPTTNVGNVSMLSEIHSSIIQKNMDVI